MFSHYGRELNLKERDPVWLSVFLAQLCCRRTGFIYSPLAGEYKSTPVCFASPWMPANISAHLKALCLLYPGVFERERWPGEMTRQARCCEGGTNARCRDTVTVWVTRLTKVTAEWLPHCVWLGFFWKCALSVWISSPFSQWLNQEFITVRTCGLCSVRISVIVGVTTAKGINFITWIPNSVNKCEFYFLISTSWLVSHLYKWTSRRLISSFFPLFIPVRDSLGSQPHRKNTAPPSHYGPTVHSVWGRRLKKYTQRRTVYTFTKNTFNFSLLLPRFETVAHCQDDSGHISPFQRKCQWPQDLRPGNGFTDNVGFDWRSYKLWLKWGHTAVCSGGGQRSAFTKLCGGSVFLGTLKKKGVREVEEAADCAW